MDLGFSFLRGLDGGGLFGLPVLAEPLPHCCVAWVHCVPALAGGRAASSALSMKTTWPLSTALPFKKSHTDQVA